MLNKPILKDYIEDKTTLHNSFLKYEKDLSDWQGVKIKELEKELNDFKRYIQNRASGLNQSNEFTFKKFYWEVVKKINE